MYKDKYSFKKILNYLVKPVLLLISACGQSSGNQSSEKITEPYIYENPDIDFSKKQSTELTNKTRFYYESEDPQGLEQVIKDVKEVYERIQEFTGVKPAQRIDFMFSPNETLTPVYDCASNLMSLNGPADLFKIGNLDENTKRRLAEAYVKRGWHEALVSNHNNEILGIVPLWFSHLFPVYVADQLYGQELEPKNHGLDFNQYQPKFLPQKEQRMYAEQFKAFILDLEALLKEEFGPNVALWHPLLAELKLTDTKKQGVFAHKESQGANPTAQTDFLLQVISSLYDRPGNINRKISTLLEKEYNTPNRATQD